MTYKIGDKVLLLKDIPCEWGYGADLHIGTMCVILEVLEEPVFPLYPTYTIADVEEEDPESNYRLVSNYPSTPTFARPTKLAYEQVVTTLKERYESRLKSLEGLDKEIKAFNRIIATLEG